MKKKLLVLLSLLFTVMIAVVGATGCGSSSSNSGKGSESESESESISTPPTPAITLSDTTLDLDLFESATLTATLENSTEAIVWTSSDESVAKVDDGVVTAYKGGTATVTATAGSVNATCTVNVSTEIGTFEFTELEPTMSLMKGSSALLDFALTYNGAEFTMAEVTATTTGDVISYADGQITANDYGTQTVNVVATVNGAEVYTYEIAVTVFEVGAVTFEGENIELKLGQEGFAISNFKATVNGVETTEVEFNVTFSAEGIVTVEDGKICPVAEGDVSVTVAFTTSQATYDVIVPVKVSKQAIKLDTIYAKGSLGETSAEIGDVTVDFTDKINLAEIIKVTCDGEEYTSFTVDGNVVTVISAPQGVHTFTLESENVRYFVEVCFYGYGVSTVEELEAWRTGNIAAYTVLLNDIDYEGKAMSAVTSGYKVGVLDGLGNTIYNFISTTGFVQGIDVTGGIKNLQLVNFIQDCSGAGVGAVNFGVLAKDNMGTIENIFLKGQLINVPDAVDHYGLVYIGAYDNSVCRNVFADLRSDGTGNHYTGPVWRQSNSNANFVFENVVYVFNQNTYPYDYTVSQTTVYTTFEDFAVGDVASKWGENWKLENGQFSMNAYDESKFTVYAFGNPSIGGEIKFVASTFNGLTYEVVEETGEMAVVDGVLAIPQTATAGTEITINVKDADGNVVKTYEYVLQINADVTASGKAIIGGTIEYTLNTNLPFENFTFAIVEGEDYATLDGTTISFSEDAEKGSVVKVEVTCSSDVNWIRTFEYLLSVEEEITDCLYEMSGFDLSDEETAPNGFNIVSKYEGLGWNDSGEYIHGLYYSDDNLDKYTSVYFGIKTPLFNLNGEDSYSGGEWMIFNLTQVSPDTWDLVITVNGEVIYTKVNLKGSYDSSVNPNYSDNALDAILFGNPSGFNPKGVDGLVTVYVTEVLGIVDPTYVEPEPPVEPEDPEIPEEPIDPIGTIIQECVYDSSTKYSETTDVTVANGFVNVYKVVGPIPAESDAIHGLYYCGINLDSYEVVTFAVKTARFNLNGEADDYSNEWLTFTLTQVADDTWDLVVTQKGNTIFTKSGLNGAYNSEANPAYGDNALDAILYGNPRGFAPWKYNDELIVYVSELRGVAKESTGEPEEPEIPVEPEDPEIPEEPIDPIGTIIQDCVYDNAVGYTATDEIKPENGFENVYKVVGTGDAIHGMYYCGINLDSYEVVTFAVKTARFSLNGETNDYSNKWLTFTLTQVADDTWDLVVTQNGETIYTKSGLNGAYNSEANPAYGDNALDAILYGNPKGFAPWTHNDELVAYVTELRGVAKESTGEPEEPEIPVEPEEPEIPEEPVETYVVLYDQVDGIGTVYNTITASFDVTRLGVDLSTVTGLTIDGASSEFTFDGATITVTGLLAGDHVYELTTADNTYKFIGCAYEIGITNATELEAWRLNGVDAPKFAVLLNDIEYDGSLKPNGVFNYTSLDGRGYTIKNFAVQGGFIVRLWSDTSVFRNVKFVNAVKDCSGNTNVGFLGQWNKGIMEDIYVDVTLSNSNESQAAVLVWGLNAPSDATNYTSTLRNVFVKVSGNNGYAVKIIYTQESNTQYMNIVGVGSNVHENDYEDSDVGYYANVAEMITGEKSDELTTFTSGYWYINSEKGVIDLRPYVDEENA